MLRTLATVLCSLTTFYWWVHLAAAAARLRRARFLLGPDTHPPDDREAPRLSVLIPARDEAETLGACLAGVQAQDTAIHEILVLDDRSTDGTAAIVDAMAEEDPRIRRLSGGELPRGWLGKNHALAQAAREASGDWLLFLDADVSLAPQAIRQALAEARSSGADMLSWFAGLEMRTFWERCLMPFVADFIVLFSPLHKVNEPSNPQCIANGQFILIRRTVYDRIGGHAANRASIIDDVSLARAVKFGGWRLRMVFAPELMRTRMYSTFGAIWRGWAKNMYPAMKYEPAVAAGALVYLLFSGLVPCLLVPVALASIAVGNVEAFEVLALAAAAGIVAYRTLIHRVEPSAYPWVYGLLHPLQAAVLGGIIIDSMLQDAGLRRTRWKGRTYGRDTVEPT